MLPFPSVPVKLIVPLYVPGVSPADSVALTAIDADALAARLLVDGLTLNQLPPTPVATAAFQVNVPPAVFVMVIVCAAGSACPTTPLKGARIAVEIAIIGVVG